jgi:hypothetical protein
MKWLILILVISCGQKNPPAKDVGDSDGDQILNYLEENGELDKFTANVKPFAEVKATLSFRQGTKLVTAELSNESNLHKISYSLLTKRADLLKLEDHFSEWSRLRILATDAINDFPEKAYDMTLRFHTTTETPDHLDLGEVTLGNFLPVMKFHLSGTEISDFIRGRTAFTLKRAGMKVPYSESSTVKQRTYRVFWNDGKMTQVYYVSHELPFERFLKLKNIIQARNIEQKQGLGWTDENKDWWIRNLGEKDKVIIKASEKDISLEMEKNFTKDTQIVKRNNGRIEAIVRVIKSPQARLFLKLRGTKEVVHFTETTRRSRRAAGREEELMRCLHWIRNINSNGETTVSSEEILKTLQVQTENKSFSPEELIGMAYETLDEAGPYLEVLIDSGDQDVRITMPNRPASTYTRTGEYQWECDAMARRTVAGPETNNESHFTTRVDTYVEKLED